MGVTGLWKLIEASGKPVPLETLENKTLAIDISIWLHQVVKGYQDNKGGHLPNAHLLGLFNRICKLLYFRIRPVFVFDGGVPELKLATIAKRSQQKTKIQTEAERLEHLLLESLAKERIVKQALGDPEKLNLSPPKVQKPKTTRGEERDDMFKLPPMQEENSRHDVKTELDDEESDDDELCPKRSYDVNINQIDVNSSQFKSLPADIRHDILTDIKETRKQNSWARLRELPVESNDFSSYQMTRLLRRRHVQIGLEAAEQEMGGKTWSLAELEALLSEDGVLEANSKHCHKIASDENTRFLLVRDIAKAMQEAKKEQQAGPSKQAAPASPQPSTSKQMELEQPKEILEDEFDLDLQRAIQMSLGNAPGRDETVAADEQSDGRIKLNPQQRQKFASTIQSHGLVRGFMMEYAEMNDTDIQDLMEATQVEAGDELNDSFRSKFPHIDDYVLHGTPKKSQAPQDEVSTAVSLMSESDTDDDLVEVKDKKIDKTHVESNKLSPDNTSADKSLVITVEADLKSFTVEEDLFADVFKTSTQVEPTTSQSDSAVGPEDVPDVEVASISSDNDTQKELDDVEASQKETESGFVSEEGKAAETCDKTDEGIQGLSENEKFWGVLDEPAVELSENEKFWSEEIKATVDSGKAAAGDVIEIATKQNTPIKATDREKSPPPAKVASPFFVNRRTPSSKKKQQVANASDPSSVAKSLFPEAKPVDAATIIRNAAQDLRNQKTSEELEQMKDQLIDEQRDLVQERNKMDRMGMSITESMSRDCKDLLKLFGIPYVDSPMEAEAQCAFLNMINLTDGTISDDSDIWLFGGQTVYKNFFVQKKIVMEFNYDNIQQMFHLDRNKLIQLAMLVGSDYTTGINGVGAVTALEILAAFPPTEADGGGTDEYQSLVSSLRKFREWFHNGKPQGPNGKTVLKSKLKNVELFEGFPNINVARAYLEPLVDLSTEKFVFGMPDTESLVEFAKTKLGWTRMKTDEILAPVMKRLNEKKQATIKDYFKSQTAKKFFDSSKMSKRVQQAVGKMGGVEDEADEEKPKKARKRKAPAKKKDTKVPVVDDIPDELKDIVWLSSDDDASSPAKMTSLEKVDEPSASTSRVTSSIQSKVQSPKLQKAKAPARKRSAKQTDGEPSTSAASADPIPVKKRAPRIPNTKQVIPQREKDKKAQELAKQKAIELFKKSNESVK